MRLLHLLVGQDLLQGPGQEHVFRLLPFIHGRDRAGGGQGWGGQRERGAGRSRRRRTARSRGRGRAARKKGRGVPTPARRGGRLGWARAAANPRGGGRTKPAPLWPLRHPRPVAVRAQSPRRPRPAPASISSDGSGGGSGCSDNLPSPCWKEATSEPRPHGSRAGGSGGSGGRGRAGGGERSASARPVDALQVERSRGRRWGGRKGRVEMAGATWELAEEEGWCFPSGPPAQRGEEGSPGSATCPGGTTIRCRGGAVPSSVSLWGSPQPSLREERPSAEGSTGRPCPASPPSFSRGGRGAVGSWDVSPSSVLRVGAFVLPLHIAFAFLAQ